MNLEKLFSEPRLTVDQLKTISDICISVSQLTLGSMVLSFLMPKFDVSKTNVIILGAVGTVLLWYFAVKLARKD
ncbi:hypothetical protein KKB40_00810 [Patescibacteria group bacterium]|nr:hypothetical protein [Patescibacteria group bacterium]